MTYDYFYGQQAEQFSFYRIPKALFTDEAFSSISTDAKLLYGILLDRMNLSAKNGWLDKEGRVYIIFTLDEVQELYDVEDGKIVKEEVVPTNGSGHGALAGFLSDQGVDALICGGIGMGAQNALKASGIIFYAGVTGSADAAAKALAEGKLKFDPDARCDHHEHHDGDCGHEHCADHHCEGN